MIIKYNIFCNMLITFVLKLQNKKIVYNFTP